MPHLKTLHINARTEAGNVHMKVKAKVNSDGEFYASVPPEVEELVNFDCGWTSKEGRLRRGFRRGDGEIIVSKTLADLEQCLKNALRDANTPEAQESNVIQYNIESHVHFVTNSKGEIFPNGEWTDDYQWSDDDVYDPDDHFRDRLKGGYSLTIGAKALTRTDYYLAGKLVKTKYEPYNYGKRSRPEDKSPAELLNSWAKVNLPDTANEIPYTDEAALFFYELMMGMAKLSKTIQENTFEQENLLSLINSGNKKCVW